MNRKNISFYTYDIPQDLSISGAIAIDTEAMGLRLHRDRLCLVQICTQDGQVLLIHFPEPIFNKSPNLCKLLEDDSVQKIFHYARFDVTILMHYLKINMYQILGISM